MDDYASKPHRYLDSEAELHRLRRKISSLHDEVAQLRIDMDRVLTFIDRLHDSAVNGVAPIHPDD